VYRQCVAGEDAATDKHGQEVTDKHLKNGKMVAPLPFHMLLATCKTWKKPLPSSRIQTRRSCWGMAIT